MTPPRHPPEVLPQPAPASAPLIAVGFIPVRCPHCHSRHPARRPPRPGEQREPQPEDGADGLVYNGTSRNGRVRYYVCRRCAVAFKAVDVSDPQ